jgi:AbrB family looped-hinge helix DNA binding protein
MSSRTISSGPSRTTISRIGQRRQVVIPKVIFEALQLQEGDFMEVSAEAGRVFMKPKKLVDVDDVLTKEEERKVLKGEAQLKRGQSKPWRAVKHGLGG